MRLHRLEVTAFGPFAGTVSVDFDAVGVNGLFLIHGPTGAATSSVDTRPLWSTSTSHDPFVCACSPNDIAQGDPE